MENVNSLAYKTGELEVVQEMKLAIFTKTWLNSNIPDVNVELSGFSAVWADRYGLELCINNRWYYPRHDTVRETECCKDVVFLAVSLWPYYMPREFPLTVVVCVYVSPQLKAFLIFNTWKTLILPSTQENGHPKDKYHWLKTILCGWFVSYCMMLSRLWKKLKLTKIDLAYVLWRAPFLEVTQESIQELIR